MEFLAVIGSWTEASCFPSLKGRPVWLVMKESSLKIQSWSQLGNPQCGFVIILKDNISIWIIAKKHSSLKEVGFIFFPMANYKWKVRFSLSFAMFLPSRSSFPSFPLHWSTSNLTMCHSAFLRYPTTQLTQPALWYACSSVLWGLFCFSMWCFNPSPSGFHTFAFVFIYDKVLSHPIFFIKGKNFSETSLNLWLQEHRWMF